MPEKYLKLSQESLQNINKAALAMYNGFCTLELLNNYSGGTLKQQIKSKLAQKPKQGDKFQLKVGDKIIEAEVVRCENAGNPYQIKFADQLKMQPFKNLKDYDSQDIIDLLSGRQFDCETDEEQLYFSTDVSYKHKACRIGGKNKIELYPMHLANLKKIIESEHLNDLVVVAMATGSGKSFLQALLCGTLHLADTNIVLFAPNALLATQLHLDFKRLFHSDLTKNIVVLGANDSQHANFEHMRDGRRGSCITIASFDVVDHDWDGLKSLDPSRTLISIDEQDKFETREDRKIKLNEYLLQHFSHMFLTATPSPEMLQHVNNKPTISMTRQEKEEELGIHSAIPVQTHAVSQKQKMNKLKSKTLTERMLASLSHLINDAVEPFQDNPAERAQMILKQAHSVKSPGQPYYLSAQDSLARQADNQKDAKEAAFRDLVAHNFIAPPGFQTVLVNVHDKADIINYHNSSLSQTYDVYHNGNIVRKSADGVPEFFGLHNYDIDAHINYLRAQQQQYLSSATNCLAKMAAEVGISISGNQEEQMRTIHRMLCPQTPRLIGSSPDSFKQRGALFTHDCSLNNRVSNHHCVVHSLIDLAMSTIVSMDQIKLSQVRLNNFDQFMVKVQEAAAEFQNKTPEQQFNILINKFDIQHNQNGIDTHAAIQLSRTVMQIIQEIHQNSDDYNWSMRVIRNSRIDHEVAQHFLLPPIHDIASSDTANDCHAVIRQLVSENSTLFLFEGINDSDGEIPEDRIFRGFDITHEPLFDNGVAHPKNRTRSLSTMETVNDQYTQETYHPILCSDSDQVPPSVLLANKLKLGICAECVTNVLGRGFNDPKLNVSVNIYTQNSAENNDPKTTVQTMGRTRGLGTERPYNIVVTKRDNHVTFDLENFNKPNMYEGFFAGQKQYHTFVLDAMAKDLADIIVNGAKNLTRPDGSINLSKFNDFLAEQIIRCVENLNQENRFDIVKTRADLHIVLRGTIDNLREKIRKSNKPQEISTLIKVLKVVLGLFSRIFFSLEVRRPLRQLKQIGMELQSSKSESRKYFDTYWLAVTLVPPQQFFLHGSMFMHMQNELMTKLEGVTKYYMQSPAELMTPESKQRIVSTLILPHWLPILLKSVLPQNTAEEIIKIINSNKAFEEIFVSNADFIDLTMQVLSQPAEVTKNITQVRLMAEEAIKIASHNSPAIKTILQKPENMDFAITDNELSARLSSNIGCNFGSIDSAQEYFISCMAQMEKDNITVVDQAFLEKQCREKILYILKHQQSVKSIKTMLGRFSNGDIIRLLGIHPRYTKLSPDQLRHKIDRIWQFILKINTGNLGFLDKVDIKSSLDTLQDVGSLFEVVRDLYCYFYQMDSKGNPERVPTPEFLKQIHHKDIEKAKLSCFDGFAKGIASKTSYINAVLDGLHTKHEMERADIAIKNIHLDEAMRFCDHLIAPHNQLTHANAVDSAIDASAGELGQAIDAIQPLKLQDAVSGQHFATDKLRQNTWRSNGG